MICPKCGSERIGRNGHKHGKANYYCKDCNRQFALSHDESYDAKPSDVLAKIAERYGPKELEAFSNGHGMGLPTRKAKPINFSGDTFKIMSISDTHDGSQWVRDEWFDAAVEVAHKEKVDEVWHAGDVSEGMSGRDGHVYELRYIGYKAQRDHATEKFKRFNRPIKMISGNHDLWFMAKGDMGGDIVEDICSRIDGAEYLGQHEGDIPVKGITARLFHGEDASAYALSYRIQKIVESMPGGEKPEILVTGHDHKMGYFFVRNVHCIMPGCLQAQTPWMRRKKKQAMPGFCVSTICIADNEVKWIDNKFYPFYK